VTTYTLTCTGISASLKEKTVFSGISFTCGGLCALFGQNGAGKTTLMRSLLGFVPGSSGEIRLSSDRGEALLSGMKSRERAKYISYMPQLPDKLGHITVLDYIVTGRTPYLGLMQSPGRADYDKARESADFFGITDLLPRYMDEISGGEVKTAGLARSMTQDTPWMLLDEPSAGLDYGRSRRFFADLKSYCCQTGRGALVSVHDPHLAEEFFPTILVMHDGVITKSDDIWRDTERIYGG